MTLPGRDRACFFLRFAFLGLAVTTLLYAHYRDDDVFLQEHSARPEAPLDPKYDPRKSALIFG